MSCCYEIHYIRDLWVPRYTSWQNVAADTHSLAGSSKQGWIHECFAGRRNMAGHTSRQKVTFKVPHCTACVLPKHFAHLQLWHFKNIYPGCFSEHINGSIVPACGSLPKVCFIGVCCNNTPCEYYTNTRTHDPWGGTEVRGGSGGWRGMAIGWEGQPLVPR